MADFDYKGLHRQIDLINSRLDSKVEELNGLLTEDQLERVKHFKNQLDEIKDKLYISEMYVRFGGLN
ncbi:MAG: hypothetical protein QXN55_00845 [Candidatus Nitrosotenuis sp.]